MIRIQSRVEGFRRAGIAHSVTPVDYPDSQFDDEALAALQAEPLLVVEVIDEPNAGKSSAPAVKVEPPPAASTAGQAKSKSARAGRGK